MNFPTRFACPSCGGHHYVVFCSETGAGGGECGEAFVSNFFPSGRDAMCPTHRHPDDPESERADQLRASRCPSTHDEIDLEKAKRGIVDDEDSGVGSTTSAPSAPGGAPRPPRTKPIGEVPRTGPVGAPTLGETPPVAPVAEYAKCPRCYVIYDPNETTICPRCGASPDEKVAVVDRGNLDQAGEILTEAILFYGKPLLGAAVGLAVVLVLLGAATGAVLPFVLLFFLVLVATLAAVYRYLTAPDIPYYMGLLETRERRIRQGLPVDSLGQILGRLRSAGPRQAPGDRDVGPADELEAALEAEERAAAEGAVGFPAEPRTLGRVDYRGGHPDGSRKEVGVLKVGPDGLEFVGPSASLRILPDELEEVFWGPPVTPRTILAVLAVVGLGVALPPSPELEMAGWIESGAPELAGQLEGLAGAGRTGWMILAGVAAVTSGLLLLGLLTRRYRRMGFAFAREGQQHEASFTATGKMLRTVRAAVEGR